MIVGELIEALQAHDPALPVVMPGSGVYDGAPAVDVRAAQPASYWHSDVPGPDSYDATDTSDELVRCRKVRVVELR